MKTKITLLLVVLAIPALALTPKEKEKVRAALQAVEEGIKQNQQAEEHGKVVQAAADAATTSSTQAKLEAALAKRSAFEAGEKAKRAEDQVAELKKDNDRMRPIVDAVTGPWWFRGGKALIYGAKQSALTLIVYIVGGFALFLIIKVAITLFTGGTVTAGLSAGTKIFGKLGRWFGRAFSRLSSQARKKLKPKPKD